MKLKKTIAPAALAFAGLAGISLAACGGSGSTPAAPASSSAPASTTQAPAPVVTTQAPAPVVTTPAAPQVLLNFTGTGKESTPIFTSSGDFTVTWSYSGNMDNSSGSSIPSNFIFNMHTPGQGGLDVAFSGPNDIAASGSGNQTVSGDDGSHYFTVDAIGTWTIKVVTVP